MTEVSIGEDDINRLVQVFNDGRYTPIIAGSDSDNENVPNMEEFEKLRKMFKLATIALKVLFFMEHIIISALIIYIHKFYRAMTDI